MESKILWAALRAYRTAEQNHEREHKRANAAADALELEGREFKWDAWVDRWWVPFRESRDALAGLVLLMHGKPPGSQVREPIALRFGDVLAIVAPGRDENAPQLAVIDVRKAMDVPPPARS